MTRLNCHFQVITLYFNSRKRFILESEKVKFLKVNCAMKETAYCICEIKKHSLDAVVSLAVL